MSQSLNAYLSANVTWSVIWHNGSQYLDVKIDNTSGQAPGLQGANIMTLVFNTNPQIDGDYSPSLELDTNTADLIGPNTSIVSGIQFPNDSGQYPAGWGPMDDEIDFNTNGTELTPGAFEFGIKIDNGGPPLSGISASANAGGFFAAIHFFQIPALNPWNQSSAWGGQTAGAVPEPAALPLLACGLLPCLALRRGRRRA